MRFLMWVGAARMVDGVSIAYDVPHPVEDIAECYAAVNLIEIYPDTYLSYEREFLTDQSCFLNQECNFVQYRSIIQTALPLNATVTTNNMVEIRWFQTNRGLAFVQRSWSKPRFPNQLGVRSTLIYLRSHRT